MTTKEQLHHLIDQLPESDVGVVTRLLEALRDTEDPVLRLLAGAPEEDQAPTDDDIKAMTEGRAQYRRGEGRYLSER